MSINRLDRKNFSRSVDAAAGRPYRSLSGGLLEGLGQAACHLLGVLVEQGVVLHDEEVEVVLLQNGHELEESVGPARVQLGDIPVQAAEDAGVVAADEENLIALQFWWLLMAPAIASTGAVGGCWHLGDGSQSGEEPPIGLILCGEKNREQIGLLQLDRGEIRVAEYLVELPPREMLGAKLGHRLSQPLLRHTFLTHAQNPA